MFKIFLDKESLDVKFKKNYSTVTAQFYCELSSNIFFPSQEWNDLLLSIADMWLLSLIDLMFYEDAVFEFMEGPYLFKASFIEKNLEIIFYEDNKKIFSEILSLSDFMEEMTGFISTTIKLIDSFNACNRDAIKITSLKSIKSNFKKLNCIWFSEYHYNL